MDGEPEIVEAPLSAGPPPLFDVTSFSKWVTDVFTEEHDDEVLDKLAAMDASDDMAKMRLLLNEEVTARRARLTGEPLLKSYTPPEEGAGSRDVMIIAFCGENDHLVSPAGRRCAQRSLLSLRSCLRFRSPAAVWSARAMPRPGSSGCGFSRPAFRRRGCRGPVAWPPLHERDFSSRGRAWKHGS